jgi:4-amino-4-deoxy-L-arabinose transferase-like glycosyltransferase
MQPSFLVNTSYLFQFTTRPFKQAFLNHIAIPHGADRVGNLLLLFFVGRRLWDSFAGMCAALFYALWPLPVAATHYVKEDTPLAFFTTLTIFFCLSLIKYGR